MKNIRILSYPGIAVLRDKNDNHTNSEILAHNQNMFYYNIAAEKQNNNPYFEKGKKRRYHNQGIRENFSYIQNLFGSEDQSLSFNTADYSIATTLNQQKNYLVTKNQRSEVYIPIAFKQKGKIIGGIYANLWNCGTKLQRQQQVESIAQKPIGAIVSASCMLGYALKGIDQNNNQHPLTNPSYQIPENTKIVSLDYKTSQFHPYETQMYQTFENLVPFFKVLGNANMPKLFFHIPSSEYIFYGLNLYLNSQISENAFNEYVKVIIQRAKKHQKAVTELCTKNNIAYDIETPMQGLVIDQGQFNIQAFMQKLGICFEDYSDQKSLLIPLIIQRCLSWLADHQKPFCQLWQWVKQQKQNNNILENKIHGSDSLLSLNYLSYVIKVGWAKLSTPENQRVCLAHPYHEKQMALSYKQLFAQEYGEIINFNWISPIISNISESNFDYYLECGDKFDFVNKLIENGLLKSCFLQTALYALDQQYSIQAHKEDYQAIFGLNTEVETIQICKLK